MSRVHADTKLVVTHQPEDALADDHRGDQLRNHAQRVGLPATPCSAEAESNTTTAQPSEDRHENCQ
ncbi:hypothetical protein IT414_02320 [bacterium]|nr:hypothetical protein [bacterium]